jgi:hypothetical protein
MSSIMFMISMFALTTIEHSNLVLYILFGLLVVLFNNFMFVCALDNHSPYTEGNHLIYPLCMCSFHPPLFPNVQYYVIDLFLCCLP